MPPMGGAPPHVTVSHERFEGYRQLFDRFDKPTALALIDRLQILALTHPEAMREMEHFLTRGELASDRLPRRAEGSKIANG
jgi:hypothetical protein